MQKAQMELLAQIVCMQKETTAQLAYMMRGMQVLFSLAGVQQAHILSAGALQTSPAPTTTAQPAQDEAPTPWFDIATPPDFTMDLEETEAVG